MTSHNSPAREQSASDRIVAIDIIRGFALFGVLLINMLTFSGPEANVDPWAVSTSWLDRMTELVLLVFVESAFLSIFSFLFGLGFALQLHRARQREQPFVLKFASRIGLLILIGALHHLFIWSGDILVQYAVAGMFLLLFVKAKSGTIGVASILLMGAWLIENARDAIRFYDESFPSTDEDIQDSIDYFQSDYGYIFGDRWVDFIPGSGDMGEFLDNFDGFYWFLGIFLAGAWVVSSGRLHDWRNQEVFYMRVFAVAAPIALVSKGLYWYWIVNESITQLDFLAIYLVPLIAGPAQGVAYMCWILLVLRRLPDNKAGLLSLFAPVGKMALTNYLMQSLVSVWIFHGYGLGLYGRYGVASTTLFAVLFFGFQIAFSHLWLSHFRMGPMEALWRHLTYTGKPTLAPVDPKPDPVSSDQSPTGRGS